MNDVLGIVNAMIPLLTGMLGAGATLLGLNLNHKWQNKRDIDANRSRYIGSLFSYINESERNIMKIGLSIKDRGGVDDALKASMSSMKSLQKEYDKSAVYLPDSIAQIVEAILNIIATINTYSLMGNEKAVHSEITKAEKDIRLYKKELRNVFQHMIGVKK